MRGTRSRRIKIETKESLFRVDGKTEVRFESSGKVLRHRVAIKTTVGLGVADKSFQYRVAEWRFGKGTGPTLPLGANQLVICPRRAFEQPLSIIKPFLEFRACGLNQRLGVPR